MLLAGFNNGTAISNLKHLVSQADLSWQFVITSLMKYAGDKAWEGFFFVQNPAAAYKNVPSGIKCGVDSVAPHQG